MRRRGSTVRWGCEDRGSTSRRRVLGMGCEIWTWEDRACLPNKVEG